MGWVSLTVKLRRGSIKHPAAVAVTPCSSTDQLAAGTPACGGGCTDDVPWDGCRIAGWMLYHSVVASGTVLFGSSSVFRIVNCFFFFNLCWCFPLC